MVKVSFGIVMVVVSDVFLNSEMIVDDKEGSMLWNIRGVMIEVWICIWVRLMVRLVFVRLYGMDRRLV